jgi:hypothetical protein
LKNVQRKLQLWPKRPHSLAASSQKARRHRSPWSKSKKIKEEGHHQEKKSSKNLTFSLASIGKKAALKLATKSTISRLKTLKTKESGCDAR